MWSIEKVGAASSSGIAAAIRVCPELRMAPVISPLVPPPERAPPVSRPANSAKLNRQIPGIEHLATRTKQTPAIHSNRQNFHFCLNENWNSAGALSEKVNAFLPGSGLQVELAVTHSKQSIGAFLPGSRIPHSASRTSQRDAHMRTVTPQGAYAR